MTKNDLRDGMVVEYRGGDRRIVCGNKLISLNGFERNNLESFENNLKSNSNKELDIVKIYEIDLDLLLESAWTHDTSVGIKRCRLIWKRKEPKFKVGDIVGVCGEVVLAYVNSILIEDKIRYEIIYLTKSYNKEIILEDRLTKINYL